MKKIDLSGISERNREKVEGIIKIIGDALELYDVDGVSDISLRAPKLKFDVHIDEVYALLHKFVGPNIIFMNEDFSESGDHTFYISDKEALIESWKDINNRENLLKGIELKKTLPLSLSYSDKEKIFGINKVSIKIKGEAQNAVLSLLFSHFRNDLFDDGVYLIEIAQEENPSVDIKKGITWADNALRHINTKARESGFENIFDVTEKKVRLCK